MGVNPYEASQLPADVSNFIDERPLESLIAYRQYCIVLAVMNTSWIGMGWLAIVPNEGVDGLGIILMASGVAIVSAYLVGPLLPRARWSWYFGLALILFGFLGGCSWMLSIPMLYRWFETEVRAHHGAI